MKKHQEERSGSVPSNPTERHREFVRRNGDLWREVEESLNDLERLAREPDAVIERDEKAPA